MIFGVLNASAQQSIIQPNISKGFNTSYYNSTLPVNLLKFKKEVVAPGFYVNNLGFFCKQEIKFQKTTNVPLKFRLGTLQYCDWMEGKRNTGILSNY
mgnify:FL=1